MKRNTNKYSNIEQVLNDSLNNDFNNKKFKDKNIVKIINLESPIPIGIILPFSITDKAREDILNILKYYNKVKPKVINTIEDLVNFQNENR